MRALFREKGAEFRVGLVADSAVQKFINAHASVLDSRVEKVGMSDAMRRRLTRSNYIFSGMKTFHELHEAFPSLLDENGNRKSFERFLNDVQAIDRAYNVNYLRAEYNFVSASAEMAGKWENFMRDGDRYNLQYRTQRDDKVRPEHAALDRVTLPPSDSFWEEFYPPNGWNCRCDVVQVRKSKYPTTPHAEAMRLGDEALQRDTRGIFRFNPGKEGKAFPDYNPYTISRCRNCDIAKGKVNLAREIPADNQLCAACRFLWDCVDEEAAEVRKRKEQFESLKENPEYKDVEFNPANGGLKATNVNHNIDKNKGWYETDVQKFGFENGHSVILEAEDHTRHSVKNTEGTWDDLKMEIAAAENGESQNIRNALKHCAKKPDSRVAVIYSLRDLSSEEILRGIARFDGLRGTPQWKEFDEIIVISKTGKIKKYRQ